MKQFTNGLVPLVLVVLQQQAYHVASFQSHSLSAPTLRFSPDVSSYKKIGTSLNMAESDSNDFWQQQRDLMKEMTDQTDKAIQEENMNTYNKIQNGLIVETAFFSALIFSVLWLACDNPFVPLSFVFGSIFGIAYTYGLGKYVSTVGGTIDDPGAIEGAGVGQARFAFLIMLFIFVGKFRSYGLMEIPSIMGFFTYQLASLSQGLKDDKIE